MVVRVLQGLADARHDGERLGRREPAVGQRLTQAHPVDELHHQVVEALAVSEVVDPDDVGMIEARHRPRLAGEPLGERRVVLQVGVEHLDGNGAVEGAMPRPVDGAHAAGTDELEVVEVGEPAAQLLGARRLAPPAGGLGGGLRAEPGA